MGTAKAQTATTRRTYRAKVTGRHAITIPADLCRELDIATGDIVELERVGDQALLRRAPSEPIPQLEGLLSDYFSDWDDVKRFIEEERRGWEDRDELLDRMAQPTREHEGS